MREVRHILRQNGPLVEEIMAVRNGKIIHYVKKDNLGKITKGTKIINQSRLRAASSVSPLKQKDPVIVRPTLSERLTNFLEGDSILD